MASYESMQLEEEACQNCFTNIVKMGNICRPKGFVHCEQDASSVQAAKSGKEQSDKCEMCSSNLLSCPVQVTQLLVVEAHQENGQLYPPSSICWLVCMIPATNCTLLASSFLKTMGDSCYAILCTAGVWINF